MLVLRPARSAGRPIGLAIITFLILMDGILILQLLSQPINYGSIIYILLLLISIPIFGIVGKAVGILTYARYTVTKRELVIDWGRKRDTIALYEVQSVAINDGTGKIESFSGMRWPGYFSGKGILKREGAESILIEIYATRPPAEQLFVETNTRVLGLSPEDPGKFRDAILSLQSKEAKESSVRVPEQTRALKDQAETPEDDVRQWSIWRDKVAQATLAVSIVLNLLLFALLAVIVNRLPEPMALHYNAAGVADRSGSPVELLILPIIGLITWILAALIGWYHYHVRGERPIGYIVWGFAISIEIATWIGLFTLIA